MRLVLTIRGTDVIDLELLLPRKTKPEAPRIEASSSGDYERADPYGDPATQHGFGFALPEKGKRDGQDRDRPLR